MDKLKSPLLKTGFILLIPLIANRASDQINWTVFDFVVAGGLIFGLLYGLQLIRESKIDQSKKGIYSLLIIAVFAVVWIKIVSGALG